MRGNPKSTSFPYYNLGRGMTIDKEKGLDWNMAEGRKEIRNTRMELEERVE
jgi:hypothetical protein